MEVRKVKEVLKAIDLKPNKALGQNFLEDENLAKWIVEQIDPSPKDIVIEIGPGVGALTRHLIGKVHKLFLLEIDKRLVSYLKNLFQERSDVNVLGVDAARADIRPFFQYGSIKLIGNLPYASGGEIMRNFLTLPTPVACAVFMLQNEVCERITASPQSKAYGVFTLRIQAHWQARLGKKVPPQVFYPVPKVDSRVIFLNRKKQQEKPVYHYGLFDELISLGFSQRRKQIRKLIPQFKDKVNDGNFAFSSTARAEELALHDWIQLAQFFENKPKEPIREEWLNVVNEEDHVIDQLPRKIIHEQNHLHRAVHIFVFNNRKELFIQRRARLKDTYPHYWDSSAAGHVNAGESYEEAAKRELKEELAISTTTLHFQEKFSPDEATGWEFIALYTTDWNKKITFPSEEIECGMFISFRDLLPWVQKIPQHFAPGFLKCLQAYCASSELC